MEDTSKLNSMIPTKVISKHMVLYKLIQFLTIQIKNTNWRSSWSKKIRPLDLSILELPSMIMELRKYALDSKIVHSEEKLELLAIWMFQSGSRSENKFCRHQRKKIQNNSQYHGMRQFSNIWYQDKSKMDL